MIFAVIVEFQWFLWGKESSNNLSPKVWNFAFVSISGVEFAHIMHCNIAVEMLKIWVKTNWKLQIHDHDWF